MFQHEGTTHCTQCKNLIHGHDHAFFSFRGPIKIDSQFRLQPVHDLVQPCPGPRALFHKHNLFLLSSTEEGGNKEMLRSAEHLI